MATKTMKLAGAVLGLLLWGVAQAGTRHYYYTDPQGTPLAKADAQGNIVERYEYTPYGVPVPSVGASPDGPGYTGHVNDPEAGLVYMQARYYDPVVGRFLSVDPVTAAEHPMAAFNRYWYANNNPYKYIDPDGRESCDWCDRAGLPQGDVIRTTGEAMGALAAYGVGVATGDETLQNIAIDGMRDNVKPQDGINAAMMVVGAKGGKGAGRGGTAAGGEMGGFKIATKAQLKGVDQHAVKQSIMGDKASVKSHNISVDKNGSVMLAPVKKGGIVIETPYNIKELPVEFPRK